ncbi:hypothetical protein ACEZDB_25465 [Streptacidiphilus sp. N1-3]|uniref:ADP-ribosylglycohydrolase n=1 Tax=Streptacidiphilus alkalitolerans TaxID=3342712 RepID=A0ABV6X6V4_9ACTN
MPSWLRDCDAFDLLFLGACAGRYPSDPWQFAGARAVWMDELAAHGWQPVLREMLESCPALSESLDFPIDDPTMAAELAMEFAAHPRGVEVLPLELLPDTVLEGHRAMVGPRLRDLPEPTDSSRQVAQALLDLAPDVEEDVRSDGSPADAMRAGLRALTGLEMADAALPLCSLYAGYISWGRQPSSNAQNICARARAWARALPIRSSVTPIADLFLTADARRLNSQETFSRAMAMPQAWTPVPRQETRWRCDIGEGLAAAVLEFRIRQRVHRHDHDAIHIDDIAMAALQTAIEIREGELGRELRGDELIFPPDSHQTMKQTMEQLTSVIDLSPATVHAALTTDFFPPGPSGFPDPEAQFEWEEAVEEYLEDHPGEWDFYDPEEEGNRIIDFIFIASLTDAASDSRPSIGPTMLTHIQKNPRSDMAWSALRVAPAMYSGSEDSVTTVHRAQELARGWSGADLAERVLTAAGWAERIARKQAIQNEDWEEGQGLIEALYCLCVAGVHSRRGSTGKEIL